MLINIKLAYVYMCAYQLGSRATIESGKLIGSSFLRVRLASYNRVLSSESGMCHLIIERVVEQTDLFTVLGLLVKIDNSRTKLKSCKSLETKFDFPLNFKLIMCYPNLSLCVPREGACLDDCAVSVCNKSGSFE
jgi:hypothetical protein